MAGFNNTPPASEFHRHSSWGRTRRPKNVNGNTSTAQATTSTSAPAATTATLGYPTENQRFLHLLLDTGPSNGDRTVTVYGYAHALGRWAPLSDTSGTAITIAADDVSAYKIFAIVGVDRVYFKINSALDEADFFYAATSTF